jgi:hypothetical protein
VVNKIHPHRFEVLPKRWVVERTWSWLMNNRRLQVDYERNPGSPRALYGPFRGFEAAAPPPDGAGDLVIALGAIPRQPLSL